MERQHTSSAVSYQRCALLAALLVASCSSDGSDDGGERSAEIVRVSPAVLEDAVIHRLSAKRPLLAASADGALSVRMFSGSVARDATLTVARIRAESTPSGVIGSAYLLSPAQTSLLKPMRIALRHGDLPAGASAADLRLARLDTGGRYYQPVSGQAVLADRGVVAGTITSFGVYAVIDARTVDVREDVPSTPYWEGVHLLDLGYAEEAGEAFAAAHATEPSADTAFTLAFTRLLNILGLPKLDAFLGACGEPVWSAAAAFGPDGYFAQEAARGRAEHDLTLREGFDEANVIKYRLVPSTAVAEQLAKAVCIDDATNQSMPVGAVQLTLTDPNYDGSGEAFTITLTFDPTKPRLDDDATLAELAAAAEGGIVTIPIEELNGAMTARKTRGEQDETDSDDKVRVAPGSSSSSDTTSKVGLFEPPSAGVNAGAITLSYSDTAVGSPFAVELVDVKLEPQWNQQPRQLILLSGTVRTTVTAPTSRAQIPLLHEGFDPAHMIDACDLAALPSLDEEYLTQVLDELGMEAEDIATLLDSILAAEDADTWTYELSLGFLHGPGSIVVGATELDAIAGALEMVRALQLVAARYHWFTGDLRDLVTSGQVRGDAECADPCAPQSECTSSVTTDRIFDPDSTAAALVGTLLTARDGAGDLLAAQTLLVSAADHLISALGRFTARTPLAFQQEAARAGSEQLVSFLSDIRAGLLADEAQDGARPNLFQGAFLALAPFFTSPPDAAALRAAAEAASDAPVVEIVATDVEVSCPPSGDEPGYSVSCEATCAAGEVPDCGHSCSTPLTTDALALCDSAPWAKSVSPSGWLMSGLMESYVVGDVSCTLAADCAFIDGGTCAGGTCEFPDVGFDDDAMETWSGDTMPGFINRAAIGELQGILDH